MCKHVMEIDISVKKKHRRSLLISIFLLKSLDIIEIRHLRSIFHPVTGIMIEMIL